MMHLLKEQLRVGVHVGRIVVGAAENPVCSICIRKIPKVLVEARNLDDRGTLSCLVLATDVVGPLAFHSLSGHVQYVRARDAQSSNSSTPIRLNRLP